ncbi:hypothetical protein K2173_010481 [Erythroxylum novogranatense]|uniref:Uncharacterized protein n=1 Tax=Erythroxylum novogranatense TaxID=1862640 RepID=A0AAV8TFH3_9ROSI|nr:hypothetical protein K2173_010481 [Erythroxylum novogranatense]
MAGYGLLVNDEEEFGGTKIKGRTKTRVVSLDVFRGICVFPFYSSTIVKVWGSFVFA